MGFVTHRVPLVLSWMLWITYAAASSNRSSEYDLHNHLFENYNKDCRPVLNGSDVLEVDISFQIITILSVDEKEQTLKCIVYYNLSWNDAYMAWDPDDYGGITETYIPADKLWAPDLFYNPSINDKWILSPEVNFLVLHTGRISVWAPLQLTVFCSMDFTNFPSDSQSCNVMVSSMSYKEKHLDVQCHSTYNEELYGKNQEMKLKNFTVSRQLSAGSWRCIYTISMKRYSTFNQLSLIGPMLILVVLSWLQFFIPVESGEKLSYAVTVVLSFTVMQTGLADMLPEASLSIPSAMLSTFVLFCIAAFCVLMSIVVVWINFYGSALFCWHHRQQMRYLGNAEDAKTKEITHKDNEMNQRNYEVEKDEGEKRREEEYKKKAEVLSMHFNAVSAVASGLAILIYLCVSLPDII